MRRLLLVSVAALATHAIADTGAPAAEGADIKTAAHKSGNSNGISIGRQTSSSSTTIKHDGRQPSTQQQQQHAQQHHRPPSQPPPTPPGGQLDEDTNDDTMTYEADVPFDDDELTYDEDGAAIDGHQNEASLYDELNVDENRREPILKTFVIVLALAMIYMGWRAHCRGDDGMNRPRGTGSGGRHKPLSLVDDDFSHDHGIRELPGSSPVQRPSLGSGAGANAAGGGAVTGWTLDVFSLAASKLAL
mmetsp:Transcript_50678/g.131779  ORF Transcript_50678/g.131779 Transcript_50678/m.131779 type:complete len:246 (+) Transcript_50678:33-770(+)